jgi:hypothetical protein
MQHTKRRSEVPWMVLLKAYLSFRELHRHTVYVQVQPKEIPHRLHST